MLKCNFCDKSQDDVKLLIAGLGIEVQPDHIFCSECGESNQVPNLMTDRVCICDECVDVCLAILIEKRAEEAE